LTLPLAARLHDGLHERQEHVSSGRPGNRSDRGRHRDRAPNGYRAYDEHAAVRVRNIRYLLAAGLTLDDVRAFLPCLDGDVTSAPPSDKGRQVALDRLAVLNEGIAAQTKIRDRLEAALSHTARDSEPRSSCLRVGQPRDRGS
jgi:DNA-binding transcriptional MerR regulator